MVQQSVAPIIPNMSNQVEAVAGSSAIIFTATDRKIIEERTGEIDRKRSFKEIFQNKPLAPKVENEQTTIKPERNIKELEGRYRDHRQMLKHATATVPRERVEISSPPSTSSEKENKTVSEGDNLHKETLAMVKELKLDHAELHAKFSLDQKELFGLISRIKELHLKRLLSEDPREFKMLSEKIKTETLHFAKEEARTWVEARLDELTKGAAEYKLGILKSLQSIEPNRQREKNITAFQKSYAPEE